MFDLNAVLKIFERILESTKTETVLAFSLHRVLNYPYTRGRKPTARRPDAAHLGILPGPRPFIVIRTATFFFFNDRYAAINRQISFFFGLCHQIGQKKA